MSLFPAPERNIRREDTGLTHRFILRFLEAGSPFRTEVEVRASSWLTPISVSGFLLTVLQIFIYLLILMCAYVCVVCVCIFVCACAHAEMRRQLMRVSFLLRVDSGNQIQVVRLGI